MTDIACADLTTSSLLAWASAKRCGVTAPHVAVSHLNALRLEDLVLRVLDMDFEVAEHVDALAAPTAPFARCPESFFGALQQAIHQLRLHRLFGHAHDGEFHRSICPSAYNERTGEHYPDEMAQWRADFRAMAPEQQMVAATLIWLYRSGADSIWLRRVPCTWMASEALQYMQDAGCLDIWLRLVARYPGW